MLAIIKVLSSYCYTAWGNREHPGNLQNKSVSSPFNWVSRYVTWVLGCHKRWKNLSFVKFEIVFAFETIFVPFLFLLDALAYKHWMTWSSMINLRIDSRTCQKLRILLSARQRSNNYLQLSKENVLGNMMLSHHDLFESSSWYGFTKFSNQFFRSSLHVLEI